MTRALILAAGLGTRLRPLTDERPKPLVEVCGRPLIMHALQLLAHAGVTEAAINSHWLHPLLPRALGDVVDVDGARIALGFSYEPVALGTGGGLRGLARVFPLADGEHVIVANADALIDLHAAGLLAQGQNDDAALATLVLKSVPDVERWGAIGTNDDDRIVTFAGRVPAQGDVARERMFCGWHCLSPRTLSILPDVTRAENGTVTGEESCINKEGYPRWLQRGATLRGFDHAGFFFDVGNAARLWEANRLMLSGDVAFAHLTPFARFREPRPRVFVHPTARVAANATLVGPCVVDAGVVVDDHATIGPFAVLGPRTRVFRSVRVQHAVVQSHLEGAQRVAEDAVGVVVGDRCRLPIDR
jgi:NDP-sugar pyrophosphorylase family protein